MREVEEQSFLERKDDENLPLDTSDRNLQQLDTSMNRSGLERKTICATDGGNQSEVGDVDAIGRPKICIGDRNYKKGHQVNMHRSLSEVYLSTE